MEEKKQFNKTAIGFAFLLQVIGLILTVVFQTPFPFLFSIIPTLVMFLRFSDTKFTKFITLSLFAFTALNVFLNFGGASSEGGFQGFNPGGGVDFTRIFGVILIITIVLYVVLCVSFKLSSARLLTLGLLITTIIVVLLSNNEIIQIVEKFLDFSSL